MKRSNTEPTAKLYLLRFIGKTVQDIHGEKISTYGQLHNNKAINMDLFNMIRNVSKFNSAACFKISFLFHK